MCACNCINYECACVLHIIECMSFSFKTYVYVDMMRAPGHECICVADGLHLVHLVHLNFENHDLLDESVHCRRLRANLCN